MNNLIGLLAVTFSSGGTDYNVNIPETNATSLTTNILNIVYFALGVVAVIMIILSGYQYLTANGEPAKAQKAMQSILYAAIGLVVVIGAFAITNFVFGRL